MRTHSGRRSLALLSITACLVPALAAQTKNTGAPPPSKPKATYPIVHVPKWEVKYTLTASERYARKIGPNGPEMYHEPSWSISGSAIVETTRHDGVIPPDAVSNSWSGETQASGSFFGEVGWMPSQGFKEVYVGGGSAHPRGAAENRLLFQLNAKERKYEISVAMSMDARLVSDVSEITKKIDEVKKQGQGKDDVIGETLLEMLRAMIQGGSANRTRPFKLSFNPTAYNVPLPDGEDGIPTLTGSVKVQEILSQVSPGIVNGIFSWTISPYDESKKADITLAGCTELGVGQQGTVTAKGEPAGGTYRFWVEPASTLVLAAEGATVRLTGATPGRATLHVEYRVPGGKTGTASQRVTCLRINSINGGQPVPKIGLFDVDGKATSAILSVPVSLEPAEAGSSLTYKPADPGVLSAINQGDAVVLQGVRLGTTTFQASTECGGPTGPVTTVEVVRCDDEVLAKLNEMMRIAKEAERDESREYHRITDSKEFQDAANGITDSTLDLAVKTGGLIIGTLGGGGGKAVSTAADIYGYGSNARDAFLKGEFTSATVQTVIQASGQAVLSAISDTIEALGAAEKFGMDLGKLMASRYLLEESAKRLKNWHRVIEDISEKLKKCRTGGEEAPKQDDPPPKTEQPPAKKDPQPPSRKDSAKKDTSPGADNPPAPDQPPADAPGDQPPGDPPLPPPQPQLPPQVGLPYDQGSCGCRPGGIAGQAGSVGRPESVGLDQVATDNQGLKNLQQCVEQFRNGALSQYHQTLNEWQALYSKMEAVAANETGREAAVKDLVARIDSLLVRTKEFDEKGRAFYAGFEACPAAVSAANDQVLVPVGKGGQ